MGHVKLANYALAYKKIKNAAFDGPGSQSTVLFFVAADVDAICAFRILTVKKVMPRKLPERGFGLFMNAGLYMTHHFICP